MQASPALRRALLAPNAHGPNEFLNLPTARRLSCVLAQVLADHYHASQNS